MPIDALATIIMLTILALVIYGPWQELCTDAARQTLFELRDELFDMATAGEMSFDSKEYRKLRASIEQNIRYAHTLTIWRFLVIYAHLKLHGDPDQKSDMTLSIEKFEGETRNKLLRLAFRIYRANVVMMVTKSPIFIILLAVIFACSRMEKVFSGAKNRFAAIMKKAGETILVEAQTAAA